MNSFGFIKMNADILTITGLHIGTGRENIEIGGLDLPIIKNPRTNLPFIPGSSLKGKMRFLTEWANKKVKNDSVCKCGEELCCVCRIFGSTQNPKDGAGTRGPTRIVVRDAELKYPSDFDPTKHIEIKWENTIDRTTGTAKNPRPLERVTNGIIFAFELVYRLFDINDNGETDMKYFHYVIDALKLLENDTLGGSGSRGCGKIVFNNIQITGGMLGGSYANLDELLSKSPQT